MTHPVFDKAFWDARYAEADAVWSGNPNPVLVAEAADLPPGSALDIGSGEGADAIWLAARGWTVTGLDVSDVALQRAAAHAGAAGVRITWRQADLTLDAPVGTGFDLVTAQFMHLPSEQRRALHRRLAAAVAPGGTLLVVGHHPSDLGTIPRPPLPDLFFTASDVAAELNPDQWEVLCEEARPRPVVHPDSGLTVTIHDTVLRARRR
ncbi:class I SAM-dependent methyltransferase [Pseudonocardia sp. 73-21]|uniref:class I SAM-dependent methyltransferase n=1 Tax=Pseudonocardia sp. 73-21 TaxID=1895809 RepID=UPI00095B0344|nr:class I SAM-dependent methyltransferase [Pseudonocardia sp. 73-21]OJY39185.1 MAG: methyltransferase type 12 [Pseudonocardia sp. 73-21]